MIERRGGSAQLYFDYNNEGWKPVGRSSPLQVSEGASLRALFATTIDFNNDGIGIPGGTPLKVIFTEENVSGYGALDSFELPIRF